MNDKSLGNSLSSAPKRPEKRGNVQSIVRNEDLFKASKNPAPFEEITLSDDDSPPPIKKSVKCPTCPKDMTMWNASRREIHVKVCQDKKKEVAKSKTLKKLTKTIDQNDVVEDKKFAEPQQNMRKWEYSKNNVKFARIQEDDEDNRRRRRPRSFAVVELAPKKCQCEIIATLHSRFMDEFHFKSLKNRAEKENGVSEHAYQMRRMLEKVTRFEQLSWDMQKTFDEMVPTSNLSSVTLKCSDGEVKCPALVLKHRTTMLRKNPKLEVVEIEKSVEVVKTWMTFVYSATIEWNDEHRKDMMELAKMYGPAGLENILKKAEERNEKVVPEEIAPNPEEIILKEDPVPTSSENPDEPEIIDPVIEPVDVFMTDDPYMNFGNVLINDNEKKNDDDDDDDIIMLDVAPTFTCSTPRKLSGNISMDSFDEWSNASPIQKNLQTRSKSSPLIQTTPKSKPVFGSHVKILKTDGVTPMPEFEKMDEAELKERMKDIGMRPKGKKAMIQILTRAYTTLHPEICSGTPTIRPLIRAEAEKQQNVVKKSSKSLNDRLRSPKKLEKVIEEQEEQEEIADKTLNLSNDEREVGRIFGDDIGDDDEEEATSSAGNSKIDELKSAFLAWLRSDSNTVLYEHILSLQPVSLEEMLIRLEKADGPLGRIGKAKLVSVLESLRITYQLPQKGGARKIGGGFKRRL